MPPGGEVYPAASFNLFPRPTPTAHSTSRYLTVFEYVKVLGARAVQLAAGASPRVPLGALSTAYDIAEAEFRAGKINLKVRRRRLDGDWEERDLRDLLFVE